MTSITLSRLQDDYLKCVRMADRLGYQGKINIAFPNNSKSNQNNQGLLNKFNN